MNLERTPAPRADMLRFVRERLHQQTLFRTASSDWQPIEQALVTALVERGPV